MDLNDHLHRLETTGPNVENVGNVSSEQRHKQILNNMLFMSLLGGKIFFL